MPGREQRLILDAVILGLAGAGAARLFLFLLDLVTRGVARGPHAWWWIPTATTLGGLVSGALVYGIAPEAEGHGTDTVVRAFHRAAGRLRARAPVVKLIASAVTIGSGGSAGREGPTAVITAGIGSVYASLTRRSDEDRRLIALMAMAAGLSAVFRSPIGTAVFAVEVLYSDMEIEARALIYTLIAAVVAYAGIGLLTGWGSLFSVPPTLAVTSSADYGWYVLLGVAAGLVASAIPTLFYGTRDLFARLAVPRVVKPALGGLGVGLLGLVTPEVLGGGYAGIQQAIDGRFALDLLAALVVTKMLAFSLTIGSGGSGGVFAPTLFVGAMVGGVLAHFCQQPAAAFAVVGMAAVFAGAARVPLAALLMTTEMTGGYHMLAPAGLAVGLSYLLQRALTSELRYRSLYEAQVPGLADSPTHHTEVLRQAAHLLSLRGIQVPDRLEPLELVRLLAVGVPMSLPDGQQLRLETVEAQSPRVGTRLDAVSAAVPDVQIVGVVRGAHLRRPEPGLALQADDRLLVLAAVPALEALRAQLAATTPTGGTGSKDATEAPLRAGGSQ